MSSQREIRLNAFDMNCVGHQSPGLWAHPRDRSWQYKDLEYWVDLARLLERGKFDGLFIADVLGVYDVLNGNGDAAIRQATQVPVNDPLALITPMALVTEHLGFGLTASLSFEHPYPFARRLSTLDHLTKGRVGWNIVTSYLESGARNIGQKAQTDHDARYDYADEYLEVVYKLLEGAGRMARCCATGNVRSSAIREKFTRLTIRGTSSRCRGSTSASRRRSVRRCSIRRAPPAAASSSPPATGAYLSARRRKCC
jgi:alkanesulfonate monooxygenase SsuD/methylene tetrahydromethanopterin reductase-like flavin-dependent oxidoreductase (luciferase family)